MTNTHVKAVGSECELLSSKFNSVERKFFSLYEGHVPIYLFPFDLITGFQYKKIIDNYRASTHNKKIENSSSEEINAHSKKIHKAQIIVGSYAIAASLLLISYISYRAFSHTQSNDASLFSLRTIGDIGVTYLLYSFAATLLVRTRSTTELKAALEEFGMFKGASESQGEPGNEKRLYSGQHQGYYQ